MIPKSRVPEAYSLASSLKIWGLIIMFFSMAVAFLALAYVAVAHTQWIPLAIVGFLASMIPPAAALVMLRGLGAGLKAIAIIADNSDAVRAHVLGEGQASSLHP